MTKEIFRSASKLTDIKPDGLAGRGERSIQGLKYGQPLPRIIHIIDKRGTTGLGGYCLRLPDPAFRAYDDLLPECERR
jgi:hypothetical protein